MTFSCPMPQGVYPILTGNTSGLLPVCETVVYKEKQYDFCLTVYFLRMAFCKVSTVSVYKEEVHQDGIFPEDAQQTSEVMTGNG